MDVFTRSLDNTMRAEIDTLHQAVQRLSMDSQASEAPRALPLVAQADRIIHILADWLLDDEQKQTMGEHPRQAFFLLAIY